MGRWYGSSSERSTPHLERRDAYDSRASASSLSELGSPPPWSPTLSKSECPGITPYCEDETENKNERLLPLYVLDTFGTCEALLLLLAIAGAASTGLAEGRVGVFGIEGMDEDNLSAFGGRAGGEAIAESVLECVTMRFDCRSEGDMVPLLLRVARGVTGKSELFEGPGTRSNMCE